MNYQGKKRVNTPKPKIEHLRNQRTTLTVIAEKETVKPKLDTKKKIQFRKTIN